MNIINFFKYKYNISLLFIMTIIINTIINSQFINTSLSDFIVYNSIIVGIFLISIIYKKDRKKTLIQQNTYEKIGKLIMLVLGVCLTSTMTSILMAFNFFKANELMMTYHQTIIITPMIALTIMGLAHVKNILYLFICMMNPAITLVMMKDTDNINKKLEKELKKIRRFFKDKSIPFQHTPPNYLVDILNCVSFKAVSKKNKATYKFDYNTFYYNDNEFNKLELYNYLKAEKLKIDTMSEEDWKIAEMYLIH